MYMTAVDHGIRSLWFFFLRQSENVYATRRRTDDVAATGPMRRRKSGTVERSHDGRVTVIGSFELRVEMN